MGGVSCQDGSGCGRVLTSHTFKYITDSIATYYKEQIIDILIYI